VTGTTALPHTPQVTSKPDAYAPSDLSRLLWGFAVAGRADAAFAKAVGAALAAGAGKASVRDAAQAVWALAKMKRCGCSVCVCDGRTRRAST